MDKRIEVELNFEITLNISQISYLSPELYEKLNAKNGQTLYPQNDCFDKISELIEFTQAVSFKEIEIDKVETL